MRELLRRALREPLTLATAALCLGTKRETVEATLAQLEQEGLIQRTEEGIRPTERGKQLARSRANRGITETTADNVVERVIALAKEINDRAEIPWTVERLGVVDMPVEENALLRHVEIVVQVGTKSGETASRTGADEVFQRLRQRSKHLVLVEITGDGWPARAREVFARRKGASEP